MTALDEETVGGLVASAPSGADLTVPTYDRSG